MRSIPGHLAFVILQPSLHPPRPHLIDQVLDLGQQLAPLVALAVGILGIGLAPTLGLALAASTLGGVGNGIANVAQSALVAARVNPNERGRAFASTGALVQTGVGVGTVAGAPIVATFGAGHAMTGAGALAAVLAGITAIWTASRTTP